MSATPMIPMPELEQKSNIELDKMILELTGQYSPEDITVYGGEILAKDPIFGMVAVGYFQNFESMVALALDLKIVMEHPEPVGDFVAYKIVSNGDKPCSIPLKRYIARHKSIKRALALCIIRYLTDK